MMSRLVVVFILGASASVTTSPTCDALRSVFQTTQADGKSCCTGTLALGDITCTDEVDPAANVISRMGGQVNLLTLTYRTGAYMSNGIPTANGIKKYIETHGQLSHTRVLHTECETGYNSDKAIPCVQSALKRGPSPDIVMGWATGIVAALTPWLPSQAVLQMTTGYGNWQTGTEAYSQYVGPGYDDAAEHFLSINTGKVAYLHLNFAYGSMEEIIFETSAPNRSTIVACSLWGLNATETVAKVDECWSFIDLDTDAVFIMPWASWGTSLFEGASRRGYDHSKIFSVWWGAPEIEKYGYYDMNLIFPVNISATPVVIPDSTSPPNEAIGVYSAVFVVDAVNRTQMNLNSAALQVALNETYLTDAKLAEMGLQHFMRPCTAPGVCKGMYDLQYTTSGWVSTNHFVLDESAVYWALHRNGAGADMFATQIYYGLGSWQLNEYHIIGGMGSQGAIPGGDAATIAFYQDPSTAFLRRSSTATVQSIDGSVVYMQAPEAPGYDVDGVTIVNYMDRAKVGLDLAKMQQRNYDTLWTIRFPQSVWTASERANYEGVGYDAAFIANAEEVITVDGVTAPRYEVEGLAPRFAKFLDTDDSFFTHTLVKTVP